jgi:2-methylisocitrate lyase-like PEP mutase family enzyme
MHQEEIQMKKINLSLLIKYLGVFYIFILSNIVMASIDTSEDITPPNKKTCITKVESINMAEINKAELLKSFHVKGNPLILYNAWDAGSAKVIQESGAKAIATSSWSVAAAQGYEDGEQVPFDAVLTNIERIIRVVNLPVTLDFEGGYAPHDLESLKVKIRRVIETGIAGINFEDQIVGSSNLYPVSEQCTRIRAIREIADNVSSTLFINARCDVFFKADSSTHNESLLEEAIERAKFYAEAGADGFFVPGLNNFELIRKLCRLSPIPVNIMVNDASTSLSLVELGVARISYGPFSYISLMTALKETATKVFI